MVKESDEDESLGILVAWETTMKLPRPKVPSSDHFVIFQPIATIIGERLSRSKQTRLEPFTFAQSTLLSGFEISSSRSQELRLNTPSSVGKQNISVQLNAQESRAIKAHTAITPRLMFKKMPASTSSSTIVAALDLEVNSLIRTTGTIDFVDMIMSKGKAVNMMPNFLPLWISSKDCITLLYTLQSSVRHAAPQQLAASISLPTSPPMTVPPDIDVLSIEINITLAISANATTKIHISWSTNVDFSMALNPAFGGQNQSVQRPNRPSSLNFSPYHGPDISDPAVSVRAASTSLQQHLMQDHSQPHKTIVSISFMAPQYQIRVGEPFVWRILIVNNSSRVAKLAIVPLPRIQRLASHKKQHVPATPKPGSSTISSSMPKDIANAVVEEQLLYALYHQVSSTSSAIPAEIDLVALTAELRIGPLDVGQCYESEIRFVAYKPGVLNVDAIRVVDLTKDIETGMGVINDITELPEIVVEKESS